MKARSGCAGRSRPSTGPTEGARIADQARQVLASFPEVPKVVYPGRSAG